MSENEVSADSRRQGRDGSATAEGPSEDRFLEAQRRLTWANSCLESAIVLGRLEQYSDAVRPLRRALGEGMLVIGMVSGRWSQLDQGMQRSAELSSLLEAIPEDFDVPQLYGDLERFIELDEVDRDAANEESKRFFEENAVRIRRFVAGAKKFEKRERQKLAKYNHQRPARLILFGGLVLVVAGTLALVLTRPDSEEFEGPGFEASYYSGRSFEQLVSRRIHESVGLRIEELDRISGLPRRDFSVRWLANLPVEEVGTYEFELRSDDGSRLWVDENLVIDSWHRQRPRTSSGRVFLESGTHRLRVEYFQAVGGAFCELKWRPPSSDEFRVLVLEIEE